MWDVDLSHLDVDEEVFKVVVVIVNDVVFSCVGSADNSEVGVHVVVMVVVPKVIRGIVESAYT